MFPPYNHLPIIRYILVAWALGILGGCATSKAPAIKLRHPFPCGVELRVSCGYGPKCSPAHKGINNRYGPNEHYAVDLIRAEPDHGFDKEVVAAASGIVEYAGWTVGGWAPYGQIVYLKHLDTKKPGHFYYTLYAHLNRVLVRAGQSVSEGSAVGTLGGSSRNNLNRFAPHLHFAVFWDSRPTLGGGRSIKPEPMGEYTDLTPGLKMKACGAP